MTEPLVLSVLEVAESLGVSRNVIYREIAAGQHQGAEGRRPRRHLTRVARPIRRVARPRCSRRRPSVHLTVPGASPCTVRYMGRNYSIPTIKTLFFEAAACAYPGCVEELIFRDRDATTVVGQIAHIRSELPGGPRHDPQYAGDIDGADNLLLLCGKHHPPVDRHESKYAVEELEQWKVAQRAAANGGTVITDDQARTFARLSPEEEQAMAQLARLAQRVRSAVAKLWDAVDAIESERARAERDAYLRMPPMYQTDEHGNQTRVPQSAVRMPAADDRQFDARTREAVTAHLVPVDAALDGLREEAAVLDMMSSLGLAPLTREVVRVAEGLLAPTEDGEREAAEARLIETLARLWSVARGGEA